MPDPTIRQFASSAATVGPAPSYVVSAGSLTAIFGSPTLAGSVLVAVISANTEASTPVIGINGPITNGTFTGWEQGAYLSQSVNDVPEGIQAGIWWYPDAPSGITTVTAAFGSTQTTNQILITVFEITGAYNADPNYIHLASLGDEPGATAHSATSTSPVTGALDTTFPVDLLLNIFGFYNLSGSTVTPDQTHSTTAANEDGTITHYAEYENVSTDQTAVQANPSLSVGRGYFGFQIALANGASEAISTSATPSTSFGTPVVGHIYFQTEVTPQTSMATVVGRNTPFVLVQETKAEWFLNGTTVSLDLPQATGEGNLLVMLVAEANATPTPTWPSGWASPINSVFNNTNEYASYYLNNPGGITSVSISGIISASYTHVKFFEFSCVTPIHFDSSAVSNGNGANYGSVTAPTITGPEELVIEFATVKGVSDTGVPTFDAGFDGELVYNDNFVGGHESTHTEYNVVGNATGTVDLQSGTSFGPNDWVNMVLAFYTQFELATLPTPETSLGYLLTPHSGQLSTATVPATTLVSTNSGASRQLVTNVQPQTIIPAGGYSPRTIPMSVVLQSRTRYIPMAATLAIVIPTRTIPMQAALQAPAQVRVIPMGVCFAFITVPMQAALVGTNTRTIPMDGLFNVQTRIIPMHGVLATQIVGTRTVPMDTVLAVLQRTVPIHTILYQLILGTRIIPMLVNFELTESNVQRIIPIRVRLATQEANVQRIIPVDGLFGQTHTRTIPMKVTTNGIRVIPMKVQSPLIGYRIITMKAALSSTFRRQIVMAVQLGVLEAQRVIPVDGLFAITGIRTVPMDAELDFVITYTRTVPMDAVLEATDTRVIPCRALLGGPTLSFIICKPAAGVKVCAQLAIV